MAKWIITKDSHESSEAICKYTRTTLFTYPIWNLSDIIACEYTEEEGPSKLLSEIEHS